MPYAVVAIRVFYPGGLSVQLNVKAIVHTAKAINIAVIIRIVGGTGLGKGKLRLPLRAVREDDISLFGFISQEEKNMFLKLITVSGVGPKMGITILSGMTPDDLAIKIATNDVKGLSSVKGLGKKTAERIILELREKVGKVDLSKDKTLKEEKVVLSTEDEDAIIALMSLGFTKQECVSAIKNAKEQGAKTIEQLISFAIKNIK